MPATQTRLNMGVIFGGRSVEHEISVLTGLQLIENLDSTRLTPLPVYIALSGRWYSGPELLAREFYKDEGREQRLAQLAEVTLLPQPGIGGLSVIHPAQSARGMFKSRSAPQVLPLDVIIPALHGTYGEDGCIQGLFELADIPYAGCDVCSAAVGMHKSISKCLAQAAGVPVLPGLLVSKPQAPGGFGALVEQIRSTSGLGSFPLIVKPGTLGSSVAINTAADEPGLLAALADVFKYDTLALVEPQITQLLELNVAVRGGTAPLASVVEQPEAAAGVLSYEDKYLRGGKGKGKAGGQLSRGMASMGRLIDPPGIAAELKAEAQAYALAVYRAIGASGVARADFLYDTAAGKLYFNEINTLPGSLAYFLWAQSTPQLLYPELINALVDEALARHAAKSALTRNFGFRALAN